MQSAYQKSLLNFCGFHLRVLVNTLIDKISILTLGLFVTSRQHLSCERSCSRKYSLQNISWWLVVFVVRLTDKSHLALFPAMIIVRGSRAGFQPAQSLSSSFAKWSCAGVITTFQDWIQTLKNPFAGLGGQRRCPKEIKTFIFCYCPKYSL